MLNIDSDDEDTPFIHSQKNLPLPLSPSTTDSDQEFDNDDNGLRLSKEFAEKINTLKTMKLFKKPEQLALNKLYNIINIKRSTFMDKTKKLPVQAVAIESVDFLLAVPGRRKTQILRDIFGIDEEGGDAGPDHKFAQIVEKDSVSFPSLYFSVKSISETSYGFHPEIEFTVLTKK